MVCLPDWGRLATFRAPRRRVNLRPHLRRGARVVEWGGLENRCALAYPGFESLSLRHPTPISQLFVFNVGKSPGSRGLSSPATKQRHSYLTN